MLGTAHEATSGAAGGVAPDTSDAPSTSLAPTARDKAAALTAVPTERVEALREKLASDCRAFDAELAEDAERAFLAEEQSAEPSMHAKHRYARLLVDSTDRDRIAEGIDLLGDLIDAGYKPAECLFAIAVGHYRRGSLRTARKHVQRVLRREPGNEEARAFQALLTGTVREDGVKGLAIVAGVTLAAIAGAVLLKQRFSGPSAAAAMKDVAQSTRSAAPAVASAARAVVADAAAGAGAAEPAGLQALARVLRNTVRQAVE